MSKSDKMLEELGYKTSLSSYDGIIEYYKDDLYIVRFYINSKRVWVNSSMTIQLLQAINKKCEELGY